MAAVRTKQTPGVSRHFPLEYAYVDRSQCCAEIPAYWSGEYEIIHVLSGEFRLTADDKSCLMRAGDSAVISPGRLHGAALSHCAYEFITFDMSLLSAFGDKSQKTAWERLRRALQAEIVFPASGEAGRRMLVPLFGALREKNAAATLTAMGYLYLFLGFVCAEGMGGEQTRRTERLREAFELIESDYAASLTLADLARSVHMSEKHFCRLFKETTQTTPMSYLNARRIEAACCAMSATERNVTEIALNVGFSDVNYFIRLFKRFKGVTPKRYMRLLSEPDDSSRA